MKYSCEDITIVLPLFAEIDDKYTYVFKTLSGCLFHDAYCRKAEESEQWQCLSDDIMIHGDVRFHGIRSSHTYITEEFISRHQEQNQFTQNKYFNLLCTELFAHCH